MAQISDLTIRRTDTPHRDRIPLLVEPIDQVKGLDATDMQELRRAVSAARAVRPEPDNSVHKLALAALREPGHRLVVIDCGDRLEVAEWSSWGDLRIARVPERARLPGGALLHLASRIRQHAKLTVEQPLVPRLDDDDEED